MNATGTFKRQVDELEKISGFLNKTFEDGDFDTAFLYQLELVIEELFMNMVRHNSEGNSDISINIEKKDGKIILSLTDHEREPFDITKVGEVDFEKYFEEKKSGGLGIHLVKEIMDNIEFDHEDGISTIRLIKNI